MAKTDVKILVTPLMGNWKTTTIGNVLRMFTGRDTGNISFQYDEEENAILFDFDTYHQKWKGEIIQDKKNTLALVRPLPEKLILDGSFHEMTFDGPQLLHGTTSITEEPVKEKQIGVISY